MYLHLLIVLIFAVTAAAPAVAGVTHVPRTGQTLCNDVSGRTVPCEGSGHDGEIQSGLSWPSPRFTIHGDGTLTDTLTGLMWAGDANLLAGRDAGFDVDGAADGKVSWRHALDYIAKLNREKFLGHGDWRLPNVNELGSLLHTELNSDEAWLRGVGFTNVRPEGYWTSTSNPKNTLDAWVVDFREGRFFFALKKVEGRQSLYRVWPVRGNSSFLPATGQKITTAPGDDAELKAGVALPEPRFSDNGDATMRDNLTGLIWSKDANAPGPMECGPRRAKKWQDTFTFVQCLNRTRYLGHNDWRVPNRNEMRSLIDYGSPSYAAQLRKAGFVYLKEGKYWTSTTGAYQMYAWLLDLKNGYLDYRWKTANYFLWPVRGGWGAQAGAYDLATTVKGPGKITVTAGSARPACPDEKCTYSFGPNEKVLLKAEPTSGAVFAGWSGACEGSKDDCTVAMDGPVQATATFKAASP